MNRLLALHQLGRLQGSLPVDDPAQAILDDLLVSWLKEDASAPVLTPSVPPVAEEPTVPRAVVAWLASGDVGTSSITIWEVMTQIYCALAAGHNPPCDRYDFGRCVRLLRKFPAWRARLPEVSARYPRWRVLVEEWERMESSYWALRQAENQASAALERRWADWEHHLRSITNDDEAAEDDAEDEGGTA